MSVSGTERRRLARIRLRCAVVVRDRMATWTAQTLDVGARGCRLSLSRPVARGALVQLRLGTDSARPLDAVGQVVWTRSGDVLEAGVAFVSAPKACASGASWIDALFAAQLRAAGQDAAASAALRELADVVLRLGVPPRAPLPPVGVAIVRIAGREGRTSEALALPGGVATLASLVARGTVTVGRASSDGRAWSRILDGSARVA